MHQRILIKKPHSKFSSGLIFPLQFFQFLFIAIPFDNFNGFLTRSMTNYYLKNENAF